MKKIIVVGMVLCILTVLVGSASAFVSSYGSSGSHANTWGSGGQSTTLAAAGSANGNYGNWFNGGEYSVTATGAQGTADSNGFAITGANSQASSISWR